MKKAVEVPQSSWKLLKDMPKLNASATEAWERGVSFRQWATEMAAISEAVHPSFAEYFRRKLDEGRTRYEKRLEQGFDEPPSVVKPEDKELETRLSLALLKILPSRMKTHALERGNTMDGISVAAVLEAIYEHMTPGGIREKNSLLQYLRSPPASSTGEELTATLRRYRLAQQRAKHLDIPEQAAHETVAALDAMVKPLPGRADCYHTGECRYKHEVVIRYGGSRAHGLQVGASPVICKSDGCCNPEHTNPTNKLVIW